MRVTVCFFFYFQVFPFCYVLMSAKSTACYKHVFDFIEAHVCDLQCASFTTDYEKAMRQALHELHPEVKRFACYLHYCQAVKKHAFKLADLSQIIFSNGEARFVYYRIMCLPLLPHDKIKEMFIELKREAYAINQTVFRPFIRYWENQWLRMVRVLLFFGIFFIFHFIFIRLHDWEFFPLTLQSHFLCVCNITPDNKFTFYGQHMSLQEGPESISVHGTSMRTTSSLEANNCRLNDCIVNHGHFFSFIRDLRKEEFMKSKEFERYITSGGKQDERKEKHMVCLPFLLLYSNFYCCTT